VDDVGLREVVRQELRMLHVLGRLLYKSIGRPPLKKFPDTRVEKVDEIILPPKMRFNYILV
jgi:hypothetical protein